MKPTNSNFYPTINALMEELSRHIKEEETTDLVKLEEALSDDESEGLSKSFGRTKLFVPSLSYKRAK